MRAVVVPADPTWPERFQQEAVRIAKVLPDLVFIHHIGSTAVPDLAAKPVIDIMPVVRDIEAIQAAQPQLAAMGYEALGEFGLVGRRYFRKGGDLRSHHLHVYAVGHPDIERHLAFRDYLRADAAERDRYGSLKQRLAVEVAGDIERYMDGKDAYIKATERLALDWWRPVPVIALSGPVGVGKTTVMMAVGDLLRQAGVAHALADRDALSEVWPRSPGDPFAMSVALANLGQLWRHARSAGARCLIVAGVLETASDAAALAEVVPGAQLQVVQLTAPLAVLRDRLRLREHGQGLDWHLGRAAALAKQLAASGPATLRVDARPSPELVATAVLRKTNLLGLLSPAASDPA
ncbi:MAG: GrpB family protein [Sulfobacillus sp.]